MRTLFAIVFLGIVYASLFPFEFLPVAKPFYQNLSLPQSRSGWLDTMLNLLFYLPLGFTGVMAFKGRTSTVVAGLWVFGTLTSLALECGQMWLPTRFPAGRDVALNSLGTLLGALAGLPFRSTRQWANRLRLRMDPGVWFLLFGWLCWQCFPFVPLLRIVRLKLAFEAMLRPEFKFLDSVDSLFGGWLIYLLLQRVVEQKRGFPLLGMCAVAVVLLYRAFVIGQTFSPVALWLTLGGMTAAHFIGPRREILLAVLLTAWIFVREIYPFAFGPAASTFVWTPFAPLIEGQREGTVRILAGKLFLYAGTIWCLRQAGSPMIVGALGIALILSAGEWLQRYLPGRTPESTDVVLALGGAVLLGWLGALSRGKSHG